MGRAIVEISAEVMREALHMPDTARIVGVLHEIDRFGREAIDLIVETPDIDEPHGGPIRRITPSITHVRERFEWSWGIEP